MKRFYLLILSLSFITGYGQDAQNNNWSCNYIGQSSGQHIYTIKSGLGCAGSVQVTCGSVDTSFTVPKKGEVTFGLESSLIAGSTLSIKMPVDCGNSRYDLINISVPTILSLPSQRPSYVPPVKEKAYTIVDLNGNIVKTQTATSYLKVVAGLPKGVYVATWGRHRQKIIVL